MGDFVPYTSGEQIARLLGIESAREVYIQKLLNYPLPLYLISVDLHRPDTYAGPARVNKSYATVARRVVRSKLYFKGSPLNLQDTLIVAMPHWSIPIKLSQFRGAVTAGALLICRDLSGDYLTKVPGIDRAALKQKMVFPET